MDRLSACPETKQQVSARAGLGKPTSAFRAWELPLPLQVGAFPHDSKPRRPRRWVSHVRDTCKFSEDRLDAGSSVQESGVATAGSLHLLRYNCARRCLWVRPSEATTSATTSSWAEGSPQQLGALDVLE